MIRAVIVEDGRAVVLDATFPIRYEDSGTRPVCRLCGGPVGFHRNDCDGCGHGYGECVADSEEIVDAALRREWLAFERESE